MLDHASSAPQYTVQSNLQQEKNGEEKNLKELGVKRPETKGADIDELQKVTFSISSPYNLTLENTV